MAYAKEIKQAVGAVRASLSAAGFGPQGPQFARHGRHDPEPDAPLMLVACSGGRDSMALAAVAGIVCAAWGLRCGAVIVDHRLQAGSGDVARQAAERCRALELDPVIVRAVDVPGFTTDAPASPASPDSRDASHAPVGRGEGLEAAARQARYGAICETARETGAAAVLLAHTLTDQAETVLIDLIRAAGTDAMAGMPPRFERDGVAFLRPLLELSREQTTAICRALSLDYWDDPTNGDDVPQGEPLDASAPLRSRVRHDLLPALNAFAGCDMAARLAAGTKVARRDVAFLDEMAAEWYGRCVTEEAVAGEKRPHNLVVDADVLARAPEAIRFRVLARAMASLGVAYSAKRLEALERFASDWHGQKPLKVSGGLTACRKKHVIRLCKD